MQPIRPLRVYRAEICNVRQMHYVVFDIFIFVCIAKIVSGICRTVHLAMVRDRDLVPLLLPNKIARSGNIRDTKSFSMIFHRKSINFRFIFSHREIVPVHVMPEISCLIHLNKYLHLLKK